MDFVNRTKYLNRDEPLDVLLKNIKKDTENKRLFLRIEHDLKNFIISNVHIDHMGRYSLLSERFYLPFDLYEFREYKSDLVDDIISYIKTNQINFCRIQH